MVLEPIASYNGVVGIYVTKHDQTCLRTLESDQLDQNCELCASISGTSQYTGDATVILRKRFALKKWLGCLDGPNQVRISESNPLRCFLAVINISGRSGKIPGVCHALQVGGSRSREGSETKNGSTLFRCYKPFKHRPDNFVY